MLLQIFIPNSSRRGRNSSPSFLQITHSGVICLPAPQIHRSIDPSVSWWLSFATGAMVGVWIAFCLSTVTEVHVWDFVEESWIQ